MLKRFNINNAPILRGKERIPFERINAKLISLGWDSSVEHDVVWGWYILAMKDIPSWRVEIRRIKPFKITSAQDLLSAIKLQEKFKGELVEIIPYKLYKGSRIFFPELSDFMDFMSEAKFPLFRKFFQTSDFSLGKVDKNEAEKNKDI